jgi:hypothetical protein
MPRKRTAFHTLEAQALQHYGLRPRIRRLELDEPQVAVRALDAGSGEPLLLLHGISLSAVHWAPMMARLGWARCIAIDMPGHGESDGADFRGVDLRRWHAPWLDAPVRCADLVSDFVVTDASAVAEGGSRAAE